MSAPKPMRAREPNCRHPGGEEQPASACSTCQHGEFLREWAQAWHDWLAENPDSAEARIVAEMDASGRYEPIPLEGGR